MKPWFIAAAMIVCTATAAFAGGVHARIDAPVAGGDTYKVHMVSLGANEKLEPWASAEGRVDGKRRSVLLRVRPTNEPGVYEFARTWPQDGQWVIRLCVGHPGAPATIATLGADGHVLKNKLYKHTDGYPEAARILHVPGVKDEDC
jgi:hypothetical protein